MTEIKRSKPVERFEKAVYEYMNEHSVSIYDAIQLYAEKHIVELETLAPLISKCPELKERLYEECKGLHLVK